MSLRVGVVAGEASGDLLGAGLIRAVKQLAPDAVFEGVAGPEMIAAGCEAWARSEELAVMGLVEPLQLFWLGDILVCQMIYAIDHS